MPLVPVPDVVLELHAASVVPTAKPSAQTATTARPRLALVVIASPGRPDHAVSLAAVPVSAGDEPPA